jgi:protein-disulfide isomerase
LTAALPAIASGGLVGPHSTAGVFGRVEGKAAMRTLSALVLALALGVVASCQEAVSPAGEGDMALGPATAKVTVIEYASLACPVCAAWNNDEFASFKKTYVDTGRVRYVLREALTHNPAVAAAGFLVARCAGRDKYFTVVDALYRRQDEIERSPEPKAILLDVARSAGLSEAQFNACVSDQKTLMALQNRWNSTVTDEKIDATPTFVINGSRYVGAMTLPQLADAIAAAETRPAGAAP